MASPVSPSWAAHERGRAAAPGQKGCLSSSATCKSYGACFAPSPPNGRPELEFLTITVSFKLKCYAIIKVGKIRVQRWSELKCLEVCLRWGVWDYVCSHTSTSWRVRFIFRDAAVQSLVSWGCSWQDTYPILGRTHPYIMVITWMSFWWISGLPAPFKKNVIVSHLQLIQISAKITFIWWHNYAFFFFFLNGAAKIIIFFLSGLKTRSVLMSDKVLISVAASNNGRWWKCRRPVGGRISWYFIRLARGFTSVCWRCLWKERKSQQRFPPPLL